MTDDLIARLRYEARLEDEYPSDAEIKKAAADALEAKDRRIEELEVELKVRLPIQEYKAHLISRIAELEAALNGAEQAMTVASQALNLYQAINPYDGGNRARHAKAELHGSLAIVRAALGEKG